MKTQPLPLKLTTSRQNKKRWSVFILTLSVFVSFAQAAEDVLWSEDFEAGDLGVMRGTPPEGFKVFTGSPIAGEELEEGSTCAELTLSGTPATIAVKGPIYVDPTSKSRLSVRIYAEAGCKFMINGYIHGTDNQQVMKEGTTNVEGYGLKTEDGIEVVEGPSAGWITMSTIFGPVGSGVDSELPKEAMWVTFIVRIVESGEGKFYIDDLILEQIPDEAPKTEAKP